MIVASLWGQQPGKYFCLSTRSSAGKWKDHFFIPQQFIDLRGFMIDHVRDDVFFCPHGFKTKVRRKSEAVMPRMCWADLDEIDPRELELRPSVAIESSPGRYVGLWLTDQSITESINRRLTYLIGADKAGWDVTQVLRLPGSYNHKYASRPRVNVLWDDGPSYTIKQLERKLPPESKQEENTNEDAKAVYARWQRQMSGWLRRELLSGRPEQGKRSEMLWKIENELVEMGLSQEEAFILVKASPWNKFAGRRNEDEQLQNELEKAAGSHFTNGSGAHKSNGKEPDDRFLIQSMDNVEEKELDWLWYPYLAKGELSILEGDPGLGKSYLAQMIAGCIVDGRSLPVIKPRAQRPPKGAIAYFDIENSSDTITKRRLTDNGVKALGSYYQDETPFSVDDEHALDDIYDALERVKPLLVVFDTINTYIGKADTHKASEVQQAFVHFRQIAKDFNCAVLVLRHLTKSKSGEKAIYRGQGSIAFAGLARVVMTVGTVPDDPDTRVMAVTKINVTKTPKAICFSILEQPGDHSLFSWGEFRDLTSDEILAAPNGGKKSGEALAEAKQFLEDELEAGPEEVVKLRRMAERRSISNKTLQRAAEALGLERFSTGFGKNKEMMWGLP